MAQWSHLPSALPVISENDTIARQSTISQLQLCGYRVALEGTEGFLPMVSEQLVFGQGLHYIVARDLEVGEPRFDLLLTMDEWVAEILVEYDWTLDKIPDVRDFFAEISAAYRSWRTEVQPTLTGELITHEEEMYILLGEGKNGNIFLRGTADAVYTDHLIDWKSSAKPWTQSKADLSIQASLYPALVKQTYNKSIRKFRFWNYVRTKHEWLYLDTSRTIREIDSALGSALAYGKQIEAGTFVPTPVPDAAFNKARGWYCSAKFCGAWNICPAKYLNDNKDENELAVRSW